MSKKAAAIRLKLQMSGIAMADADILMQHQSFNRLCYSCYYATRALLLTKDISPKTHKGVITTLGEAFVQQQLFDTAKAAFFSALMEQRHISDYDDVIITNEREMDALLEKAKEYIAYVTKRVEDYLSREKF